MTQLSVFELDVLGGYVGIVTKATAVLLVGAGIAALLHTASAAIRHGAWLLALTCCLLLILLTPFAPPIKVAIQVPAAATIDAPPLPTSTSGGVIKTSSGPVDALPSSTGRSPFPRLALPELRFDTERVLFLGWLLGCVSVLIRVTAGWFGVASLRKRAWTPGSNTWNDAVSNAKSSLGIRRPVTILFSEASCTPLVTGWMRPVILLPPDADDWSPERRRVVLIHELAHVARRDHLANIVAAVASMLLWFHPLVWLAVARLRAEAEQAADDAVLRDGTSGTSYATHLLDFARESNVQYLSAAYGLNIGSRAPLERRIRALLDQSRRRNPAWSAAQMLVAACACTAMIPSAGVRAVPFTSQPSMSRITASSQPGASSQATVSSQPAASSQATASSQPAASSEPTASSQPAAEPRHGRHSRRHGARLHDGEHSDRLGHVGPHHVRHP